MNRSAIYLVLFFCSMSIGQLASQSLYHNAWRLSEILNNQSTPLLYFSDPSGIQSAFKEGPRSDVSETFPLDSIGTYHFRRHHNRTTDTTWLIYQTDTIPIAWNGQLDIDNMPGLIAWTAFNTKIKVEGSGDLHLGSSDEPANWRVTHDLTVVSPPSGTPAVSYTDPGHYRIYEPHEIAVQYASFDTVFSMPNSQYFLNAVLMPDACVFQIQTKWHAQQYRKLDYYQLIALLALHANFKDTTFSHEMLDAVYQEYQENDYLRPLLQAPLYAYNLNEILDYMDFEPTLVDSLIKAEVAAGYGWQSVLYQNADIDPKEEALNNGENYYQFFDTLAQTSPYQLQMASEGSNADYRKVTGFDTQSIIAGLSDFIVERAQEELNIAFIHKFEQFMKEYPEMQTLFPNTLRIFLQFNVYNYKKLLQNARPSFAADLDLLGQNIPKLLDLDKYQSLLNHSAEVYNLALFYEISRMVYQDKPLETILLQSYRSVAERQQHLGEIVNLQLAKKLGANNSTIQALQNEITYYSDSLQNITNILTGFAGSLKTTLRNFNQQISPDTDPLLFRQTNFLDNQFTDVKNITASPHYMFKQPGGKVLYAPDYFKEFAVNYLGGTGYYGIYLEETNPSLSAYNSVFSERPDRVHFVAKGLELTRVLLHENYTDNLQKQLYDLDNLNTAAKELTKKIILKKRLTTENRLLHQLSLRTQVALGIEEEVTRWESNGFPVKTNMDVAALQYLNNLLDSVNQAPWNRLYAVKGLMEIGLPIGEAFSSEDLTPEAFELLLATADDDLRMVYQTALARIDTLKKYNPGFPTVVNQHFSTYLNERDSFLKVDEKDLGGISDFDEKFKTAQQQISGLSNSVALIRTQIDQIEKANCSPALLKARKNAGDLKMALEFTIHLLYSLKERQGPDTLFYRDTTLVQYQIKNARAVNQDSTMTFTKQEITKGTGSIGGNKVKWVSRAQYDSLLTNPTSEDAFLGLLFSRLRSIEHIPGLSSESLPVLTTKLFNAIFSLESERLNFNKKKQTGVKLEFRDYYPFLKTTIGALNTVLQTPIYHGHSLADLDTTLALVPQITTEALSLYDNISVKEYGYAIYNAMEIFRTIIDANIEKQKASGKDIKQSEKIRNKALLYGTFMADVVEARSSDQVKLALQAAAVPPGSSRLKRDLGGNLSLNSYIGMGLGLDWLRDAPNEIDNPKLTTGLSVPIGLSASSKLGTDMRGSFTLFVPILDIGAVTSFRIDNNSRTNDLPELSFENFIAPGAFIFYNFPNAPISIGSGWQYGPQLRKIEVNGVTEDFRSSRFMFLNVLVDVPIFNFANGNPIFSKQ